MAIAVLSPVSMKAEEATEVIFTTSDSDFYVKVEDIDFTGTDMFTDGTVEGDKSKVLAYDGKLDYVNEDLAGVKVEANVWYTDPNGNTSKLYSGDYDLTQIYNKVDASNPSITDGVIEIEFVPTIDYVSSGSVYDPKTAVRQDGVDDRKQTVLTLKTETWTDKTNSGTGSYTTSKFVGDDEDDIESYIKSLNSYAEEHRVGSGRSAVKYKLVYYVVGTTVTAEWEADPETRILYRNPLDANGDGVVTCEEAHGKGWVWAGADKGCQYTGGSTYIVNTATK